MELDDQLGRGGLPPVEVDTTAALDAVTGRGRRRLRRRRTVLGATAAIVLVAAGASAFAFGPTDDDGPNRVSTSPTGPTGPTLTGVATTEPDATPTTVPVPADPEPGDDAVWRIDPLMPPASDDTSFVALVSRQGCSSGVTGAVLRPGVRFEPGRVVVETSVEPDPDGGRCPANDEVRHTVELGQPLGDRVLVDAACLPGAAAETTTFCSADSGWAPERWYPDPPSAVSLDVPGGPDVVAADRADAAATVEAFLGDVRAGRFAAAAERWSGYPYPDDARREDVVRASVEAAPLLADDADPTIDVVASTGSTDAAPIVVVRAGDGSSSRAYAFVVGREDDATMRIQRLPEPGSEASTFELGVPEGAEVVGGRTIVLPASPVEGGVRVHVDGEEVGGRFDLDTRTVRIVVPEGAPGPISVTVAAATPELPAATSWAFVRR